MKTSYRQYPHPVLKFYENDYIKSRYKTDITSTNIDGKISLDIIFGLECDYIKNLIEKGKAVYLIHLECKNTKFRKSISTSEEKLNIMIDSEDVDYEIEVCSRIIAKVDIKEYFSEDFDDEFENIKFYIEKGSVLALDEDFRVKIDKEGEGLGSVPSIFSIMKKEELKRGIEWSAGDERIIIALSQENYEIYKGLKNNKEFASIMAVMIIIPVLTDIINGLKINKENEITSRCIDIIKNKIDKLGINLDSKEASVVAYELLDGAIEESFINLKDIAEEVC